MEGLEVTGLGFVWSLLFIVNQGEVKPWEMWD